MPRGRDFEKGDAEEMAEPRWDNVTLAVILALLHDVDHVFVVHRLGPHTCEGVTEGLVREVRSTQRVEVCGDNVVERLSLDLENLALVESWTDEVAPVLIITIGGKVGGA